MTGHAPRGWAGPGQRQRASTRGFTLIEAILALVIVTAMSVYLLDGLRDGWRSAAIAEGDGRALAIARGELARAGVEWPLAERRRDVDHGRGYRSVVEADPRREPVDEAFAGFGTDKAPTTYAVRVVVTWREVGTLRPREVRLQTIKLASGP